MMAPPTPKAFNGFLQPDPGSGSKDIMKNRCSSLNIKFLSFFAIACSLCIYFLFTFNFPVATDSTPLPSDVLQTKSFRNIHHRPLPAELINKKLRFDQVYEPRPVSFTNYKYSDASNSYFSSNVKIILLWTPWNGLWETINYYFLRPGNDSFTSFHCPNQKCLVTKDETLLERADAVLFYLLDIERRGKFPTYRRPNQKWILYIMEAPWQVGVKMDKLRSLFNWTMSYREDSDIVVKYGFASKRMVPLSSSSDDLLPWRSLSKRKSAVWFVSDCKTESRREAYVRDLRRFMDVDVYGLCGSKKCFPSQSDVCYQTVLKNYKFYLSFENSICRDYVTEKFFNILTYDIVPVVFGGANYSQLAPPGSYIDATTFSRPRDLAAYLKKVGDDETLYRSFLKWKVDYGVYLHPWMCLLCDRLHEPVVSTVREDVKQWWMTDSSCKKWTDNATFDAVVR